MKKIFFLILLLALSNSLPALAQMDSINVLDEVFLTDKKLKEFSTGQTVIRINDSVAKLNSPLLTSVLNYNSHLYFKENGLGMVSSPSFRGTTASQTAVLWNGININSQFTGQIDFNTINAAGYDDISVRGGGGSVVYGTGAIGGTVHLNTSLSFSEKLENSAFIQYGGFNTLDTRYQLKAARGDWTLSVSGARNSSDNNYTYPRDRGENINGKYYNTSLNVGLAYRFNKQNVLKFYSEYFDGERHFSLMRPSETKTKYQNFDSRNLLEWESKFFQFTSSAKLAVLNEEYKYFPNIASKNYSFGDASTYIARHDLKYKAFDKLQLNSVITNTYTNGKGSSLGENSRNIFSAAFLLKQLLDEKFSYEAGIRKEVTGNYNSPILYSAGAAYNFSSFYEFKMNASKNFRIPTYNDLYWSSSGNTNLAPETSLQAEIGNRFSWHGFELNLTAYYNDIKDMIRWLPGSDGIWRPVNEDEVRTYGIETLFNWKKQLQEYGAVNLRGTYAYTISQNKQTLNQLIYVPYHKTTAAVVYSFSRLEVDYQFLFNGEVFTRTDNNLRYNLDSYMISNLGASYLFGSNKSYRVGTRILNIFNEAYESVENRWMPGINSNFYLNLNF